MKITIWGKQYPLRLDTKDLHLSFPGIETMERNKAKDSDLVSMSFYINGFFFSVRFEYSDYGLKIRPDQGDTEDLQFLFDNFEEAHLFTLFFRDRSVVNAHCRWTGTEMEIIK